MLYLHFPRFVFHVMMSPHFTGRESWTWVVPLLACGLEWFGVRHHWGNFLFSRNAPVVSHSVDCFPYGLG